MDNLKKALIDHVDRCAEIVQADKVTGLSDFNNSCLDINFYDSLIQCKTDFSTYINGYFRFIIWIYKDGRVELELCSNDYTLRYQRHIYGNRCEISNILADDYMKNKVDKDGVIL